MIYPKTFKGQDLTMWLLENIAELLTEVDAIEMCQSFLDEELIVFVNH